MLVKKMDMIRETGMLSNSKRFRILAIAFIALLVLQVPKVNGGDFELSKLQLQKGIIGQLMNGSGHLLLNRGLMVQDSKRCIHT